METLGDAWRDAARGQSGGVEDAVRNRALHWYHEALMKLSGLSKLKVEQKIEKLEAETPGRPKLHPVLGYRLKRRPLEAVRFGRHWYQALPEQLSNPEEVRKRCQEMGGYLVCIETEDEQAFVEKIAGQRKYWIGGRSGDDGKWSWMNGSPITFAKWCPGQPNGGARCAQQFWPGERPGWHDIGSNETYPAGFICEWEF
jgi:hypothetical protein